MRKRDLSKAVEAYLLRHTLLYPPRLKVGMATLVTEA